MAATLAIPRLSLAVSGRSIKLLLAIASTVNCNSLWLYGHGTDRIENTAPNSSYIVACVSVAAETFLSAVI
jgi:hypothetical protein